MPARKNPTFCGVFLLLKRHCGQGNRPMSFRGVKRRGNPLNRNKNRLTIATNRISPRAYYRTENLRYQFKQGQELLPQLRQIICLVKVGRDTHTRCITVAEDYSLFEAFLYTLCACSKTEHEPQRRRALERRAFVAHKLLLLQPQQVVVVRLGSLCSSSHTTKTSLSSLICKH